MNLIIVESPTKAQTISRFLKGDFKVLATMGHIRDLPEKRFGVKIVKAQSAKIKAQSYEFLPQYVLVPKKKEVVEKIKAEAQKAKKIYLATDPDREGEAIAWHVQQILNFKFKILNLSRITFHEITQSAIEKALAHPGEINLQLVDAQQARRILDRIVGYKLSPLLWYKIRKGLSAGRVQSVAVRLIVEREREIEKFVPQEYWEIWAEFCCEKGLKGEPSFLAKLSKINGNLAKISNWQEAEPIVEELKKADYKVLEIEKKEVIQTPPPPFTTSTMQQKAAQVLRFSAKKTMQIAQQLYEKGLITYHRTDSVALASEAIDVIRDFIAKNFGKNFLPENPRIFKTRSRVAQEAHEAIRPTSLVPVGNSQLPLANKDEERLYELIFKRAVASQMREAIWDQTKITVEGKEEKNIYILEAEGKVIKFAGWLKIYNNTQHATHNSLTEKQLPAVNKDDGLLLIKIDPQQKFTQPPPRYTEASLIKTLEKMGIGRPSTYAPIVSTIQERQYVEKIEGKFHPTTLGMTVNDFLFDYFPDIIDYDFTAKMEEDLDEIANGKKQWQVVLSNFYGPFSQKLEEVIKGAEKVKVPTQITGEKCPKCKADLVVRIGKFGKFIACSRFPECDYKTPYVQKVAEVKCPLCGGEVVVRQTKNKKRFYGCVNWPKCNWASWRKPKKIDS
ncbi:MAG: type I DNA topoisomerase [Microgenomates group bacterium]